MRESEPAPRQAERETDARPRHPSPDDSGDYQHRALLAGHPIQRAWHRTRLNVFDWFWSPRAGERVVDLGCGSGIGTDALARKGADALGIDCNPAAVAYATRTFGRPGCSFRVGALDALALDPESFDAAVCCEVIEHLLAEQTRALLRTVREALRPGGTLVLTTPNSRGFWPVVEWLVDRFGSAATMAGEQHVQRITRAGMRAQLEAAGFAVLRIRAFCTFAPFLAPVSERWFRAVERWERRVDLAPGNLLLVEAKRRD